MATYFVAQRTTNHITLYLSPKQPIPPVPFELKDTITPEVWGTRLPIINKVAARYSKPYFERAVLLLAFLAMIALPIGLHDTLVRAFGGDPFGGPFQPASPFIKARGVEFALSVGSLIFFLVPIAIWKAIGRKQVAHILARWAKADSVLGSSSNPLPTWKVRTPGVWNSSTVLTLTLPANYTPSNFHPDAYLPSYINRPVDEGASYYYPYKPEPGMPRMSVVGNVPLYNDEKQPSNFVDVKV